MASPTADIPDFFFQQLAAAGPGAVEKLQVEMSESGISTTAGRFAKGLIQWEPESYPGDGFAIQSPAALKWWDVEEKNRPYQRLGDYYAAVFLPGRRVDAAARAARGGHLTLRGESFYTSNPLLDPEHLGYIDEDTLETFANRPQVVNSPRFQDALARLRAAGGTSVSGGGIAASTILGAAVLVGAGYLLYSYRDQILPAFGVKVPRRRIA